MPTSQCSAYIPNRFFALLEGKSVELQFAPQLCSPYLLHRLHRMAYKAKHVQHKYL